MKPSELLAGIVGFFVGAQIRTRRSVTAHRIRLRKNPAGLLLCQFCGRSIPKSRKKTPLGRYRKHLKICPAIIPVTAAQCDCGISLLKNVAETQQDSDQE